MPFIVIINQSSVLLFLHIDIADFGQKLATGVDHDDSAAAPPARPLSTRVTSSDTPELRPHSHHTSSPLAAHWRDLMPGARTEIGNDCKWTVDAESASSSAVRNSGARDPCRLRAPPPSDLCGNAFVGAGRGGNRGYGASAWPFHFTSGAADATVSINRETTTSPTTKWDHEIKYGTNR